MSLLHLKLRSSYATALLQCRKMLNLLQDKETIWYRHEIIVLAQRLHHHRAISTICASSNCNRLSAQHQRLRDYRRGSASPSLAKRRLHRWIYYSLHNGATVTTSTVHVLLVRGLKRRWRRVEASSIVIGERVAGSSKKTASKGDTFYWSSLKLNRSIVLSSWLLSCRNLRASLNIPRSPASF